MRAQAVLAAAALLALCTSVPMPGRRGAQKLLLVSFDGFRWNYDQDVNTPNLNLMAREGVKARYLTPAFITITSPCHFTLLTGKYIENHGVIHNMFFNTTSKVKFPYHPTQGISSWWDNGSLPIWITAQRQGLKTGSLFFPGGNATYGGEQVQVKKVETAIHKWGNETEWQANVETVMKWFTEDALDFVALYFGEPDSTGHKYGPESTERKDMVRQLDRILGHLRSRIEHYGLTSKLNLILTADHGMRTVLKEPDVNEIVLARIANFSFQDLEFDLVDYGPAGLLLPKEGKLETVYQALKGAHPNLHVYKKEEMPQRLHYSNNSRILPLVVYGDPGYVVHGRFKLQFNKGEHGFDNDDMDMKTIFRAVGPAFKSSLEVEPFESVHVYALMCELLGIQPEPHDGSLEVTGNMLHSYQSNTTSPTATAMVVPHSTSAAISTSDNWSHSTSMMPQGTTHADPVTASDPVLLQVVIALASVTGVLLLIFIIGIIVVVVKRKRKYRRSQKSMSSIAALKQEN